jgi:hypothetical protein
MLVRATRWFLVAAPVLAGILVMIFGTAGSISTTFGIVLIGIGPIVWMWNWLVQMSFDDDDRPSRPAPPEQQTHQEQCPQRPNREPAPRHPRRKLTRVPRRRS